jgi:hypothetical protein
VPIQSEPSAAVGGGEGVDFAAANPAQPVWRAHPKVAVHGRGQRENHVTQQAVANRVDTDGVFSGCIAVNGIEAVSAGTHPERARMVFDDGGGCVGGKTFPRANGAEALIAQNVQSVGLGSRPDVSLVVFRQRQHRRRGQRVGDGQALKFALGEPSQTAVGADPESAFAVGQKFLDLVAGQFTTDRELRFLLAAAANCEQSCCRIGPLVASDENAVHMVRGGGDISDNLHSLRLVSMNLCITTVGPDPNDSVRSHAKGIDVVPRQPVFGGEGLDCPVLPARQPVAGADPQRALAGFQKAADVAAGQGWGGVAVKDLKAVAVEADEADLGAQPDEAIAGLDKRLHRILREAVLHYPRLAAVVGQRRSRLKRQA